MTESKQLIRERSELNKLEPWEFQYYTLHFNCSEAELKSAIESVGCCPDDLSNALAGE